MSTITGFPPIADENAIVLILGSMPSIKSLEARQYYAHPQNSFWFIMTKLLGCADVPAYSERKKLLTRNRVALWDVLKTCRRKGSLDSSIENGTTVLNDFNTFFAEHPSIRAVFFNGSRAQQEYNRSILPSLDPGYAGIAYERLPSTSPAMASLSRDQKLKAWKRIMAYLDQPGCCTPT